MKDIRQISLTQVSCSSEIYSLYDVEEDEEEFVENTENNSPGFVLTNSGVAHDGIRTNPPCVNFSSMCHPS